MAPTQRAQQIRQIRHGQAAMYRALAAGIAWPQKPTDAVLVHHRTQVALDGLDCVSADTVLVWGVNHLAGLAEGLTVRGFNAVDQTWHTVGRLPSILTMLATTLATVLRNLGTLPQIVRNARQAARTNQLVAPPPASAADTTIPETPQQQETIR